MFDKEMEVVLQNKEKSLDAIFEVYSSDLLAGMAAESYVRKKMEKEFVLFSKGWHLSERTKTFADGALLLKKFAIHVGLARNAVDEELARILSKKGFEVVFIDMNFEGLTRVCFQGQFLSPEEFLREANIEKKKKEVDFSKKERRKADFLAMKILKENEEPLSFLFLEYVAEHLLFPYFDFLINLDVVWKKEDGTLHIGEIKLKRGESFFGEKYVVLNRYESILLGNLSKIDGIFVDIFVIIDESPGKEEFLHKILRGESIPIFARRFLKQSTDIEVPDRYKGSNLSVCPGKKAPLYGLSLSKFDRVFDFQSLFLEDPFKKKANEIFFNYFPREKKESVSRRTAFSSLLKWMSVAKIATLGYDVDVEEASLENAGRRNGLLSHILTFHGKNAFFKYLTSDTSWNMYLYESEIEELQRNDVEEIVVFLKNGYALEDVSFTEASFYLPESFHDGDFRLVGFISMEDFLMKSIKVPKGLHYNQTVLNQLAAGENVTPENCCKRSFLINQDLRSIQISSSRYGYFEPLNLAEFGRNESEVFGKSVFF